MSPSPHAALLPPGFADLLPPLAAHESELTQTLLQLYRSHGYELVKPPLLEFEDSLLVGAGSGLRAHTFRLMDPLSGRMLGLRADVTVQIARIATTRIADQPRPLRLAYAGQTVQQINSEHRPERQFGQVGFELIGSASPDADAETIMLACQSLAAVGITASTLDISLPTLMTAICAAHNLDTGTMRDLRHALDRKDRAAVAKIGGDAAALAGSLLRLGGRIEPALEGLAKLELPAAAAAECDQLRAVWEVVARAKLPQQIMVDFVEHRGFEYQTGLSFTLFANTQRLELGRGGRYLSKASHDSGPGEPATGFTFYTSGLLAAAPMPTAAQRLYIPYGSNVALSEQYRQQGYVTVAALMPDADAAAAAKTLCCTHILHNDQPVKLEA